MNEAFLLLSSNPHLGRAAGSPAGQGVCQVDEELADAGLLQEGAEEDEQEDKG